MTEVPLKKPKKSIHEFFKPYLKHTTASTIPVKRPSPSLEDDEPLQPLPLAAAARQERTTRTPKTERSKKVAPLIQTPKAPSYSPVSARGSKTSLSIRSRKTPSKTPVDPASIYKQATLFDTPSRRDATPKVKSKGFSFADLPSSTQTVVKDGMVIEVRDSDEDTDSLVSLDGFFTGKKSNRNTTSPSSPEDDEAGLEAERVKTLSLFTHGRSEPLIGKEKIRALRAKDKAFTFHIDSLLNDHWDDQEAEDKVNKARENIDAVQRALQSEKDAKFDKNLLAAVAQRPDDENGHEVAKLMDAVDRTEALESEAVFLFFGVKGLQDWRDEAPVRNNFPEEHIPSELWRQKDVQQRSRAYTSGIMADLASQRRLHDEALSWTFENVVLERENEVRQAYVDCLRRASSSWTRNNLASRDVQVIFQRLGADSTSLQDSAEIKPRHQLLHEPEQRDPKYLLSALDVFDAIHADMDFEALSKLTSILCRLAIDAELMSDCQVSDKVETLLSTLLSQPDVELRTHVAERIIADVGTYLKNATLEAHLLSHILPTSPTASRTRILLAQIFLFGPEYRKSPSISSLNPTVSLDILAKHISTSPDFNARRRCGKNPFDYTAFRARLHILDIAISDGGRPQTSTTPTTARAQNLLFNKSVDNLADVLESIYTAISDSGASHISRTIAKDDLGAVIKRLLCQVRTEGRMKRHIFDGEGKNALWREESEVKEEERRRGFMARFLERKKNGAKGEDEELLGRQLGIK
jgi:hypothetical protein